MNGNMANFIVINTSKKRTSRVINDWYMFYFTFCCNICNAVTIKQHNLESHTLLVKDLSQKKKKIHVGKDSTISVNQYYSTLSFFPAFLNACPELEHQERHTSKHSILTHKYADSKHNCTLSRLLILHTTERISIEGRVANPQCVTVTCKRNTREPWKSPHPWLHVNTASCACTSVSSIVLRTRGDHVHVLMWYTLSWFQSAEMTTAPNFLSEEGPLCDNKVHLEGYLQGKPSFHLWSVFLRQKMVDDRSSPQWLLSGIIFNGSLLLLIRVRVRMTLQSRDVGKGTDNGTSEPL